MLWIINCYYAQTNPYDSVAILNPVGPNVISNPKLRNPSQRLMEVGFIYLLLFTFCLSLHNFSPVYPIAAIQTLKSSWCYGDSHVICTRSNDYNKAYQALE